MEDRGIYLTVGGGLVALVVVATGFSSFMDGRAARTKANREVSGHVAEDKQALDALRKKVEDVRVKWTKVAHVKNLDVPCEAGKKAAAERAVRIAGLVSKKADLNAAIAKREGEFLKYRADYRLSAWHSATGESLDELRTKDGREYRQVTISRVTEEGIEIRHEHGTARIKAELLADSWQRRFQWKSVETLSSVD